MNHTGMSIVQMAEQTRLGAIYDSEEGSCSFTVWAPFRKRLQVRIHAGDRLVPMEKDESGYWKTVVRDLSPGERYRYQLDGDLERPDPASRYQPEGVHGWSAVVDGSFPWTDARWTGMPLRNYIMYELHIGTFTRDGTFAAAAERLDYLKELGVTAVEIMPVAQFPGSRNWGYDGVYPFAPQNTYGGPAGLKALVNEAHSRGLAVILDVVYNHLGPEGNYLHDFGPYFTSRYRTPWGDALNFDGACSDGVRAYFIENALYWLTEYHIDALRLDAIDTMYDHGARHILSELADAVHGRAQELGRSLFVIAESDLNDVRVVDPPARGGYGIDAQWSDDFHHALHALLTGERNGYYQDFGTISHLEKAFRDGFVNDGIYSAFRKRKHGNSSRNIPYSRFVVCSQNHDQVGNRMLGERLSSITDFEKQKLAAACVILSPFLPLLFMGEEYGETAPFQYFVDHLDDDLVRSVRQGRAREFSHFQADGAVPDPQDEETFRRSRIDPGLRKAGRHAVLFRYYQALIRARKTDRAVSHLSRDTMTVKAAGRMLTILASAGRNAALILYSFNPERIALPIEALSGTWERRLDSSDTVWRGPGGGPEQALRAESGSVTVALNPFSAVLYSLRNEE